MEETEVKMVFLDDVVDGAVAKGLVHGIGQP
jgi:hypothetical protein